jgi:CRP-like cAMP-binding protein
MRLAGPELLADLPDRDARDIEALGTERRLASGSVLFELGGEARHLYIVQRGRIALSLPLTVGGRARDVLVEERGPGQTVGWSALIPPHRFTLHAVASLDSDVLDLPREALEAHLGTHPAAGYRVARNVAAIVGQRLQVVQAMWLREMQRRVAPSLS